MNGSYMTQGVSGGYICFVLYVYWHLQINAGVHILKFADASMKQTLSLITTLAKCQCNPDLHISIFTVKVMIKLCEKKKEIQNHFAFHFLWPLTQIFLFFPANTICLLFTNSNWWEGFLRDMCRDIVFHGWRPQFYVCADK